SVDIVLRRFGDAAHDRFGRRVDDVDRRRAVRIDPVTCDIKPGALVAVIHEPVSLGWPMAGWPALCQGATAGAMTPVAAGAALYRRLSNSAAIRRRFSSWKAAA